MPNCSAIAQIAQRSPLPTISGNRAFPYAGGAYASGATWAGTPPTNESEGSPATSGRA